MRNRPLASGCLILFLLITVGIICGGARFIKDLRPSILEETVSGEVFIRLSGQVYDIDVKENYQILYLKKNSIIYQNKSFKESKIIVYDEGKLNIEIGNCVEVSGKMSFYEDERNPGNFNQKLYYRKQGIRASVWSSKILIIVNNVDELYQTLYRLRMQWKTLLCQVMGEEEGAILSAVLLAEKSGINEETKELYQANGIAHILAISGLHLSVIGIGLYKLFRRLFGSFLVSGIAGISFLVLYILMIGMSVSVLRAFIMFLFRVGADMEGRHYDSLTAFSFSAIVTIIWKPLYLFDGGFWLSYGAIFAIILVLPMFENVMFQGFWSSVSINLMTLPIMLYYFYEVPLYSVFLNMIVVPFMTVVLTFGLAGSLCCTIFIVDGSFGIGGIGGILLGICKMIFKVYEKSCEWFLKLPGARIVAGQPEVWQIVVYYGVLLMVVGVWWKRKRFWEDMRGQELQRVCYQKKIKWLTIFIIFLDIVMIVFPMNEMAARIKGEMSITLLDVGQGDGIFVRGPEGNTYLIDGGSSDVKKVGKYRIEPFLKSQGVGKIDYVFISHGDGDHISGITEMIKRMNVGVAIETIVFPNKGAWDEELEGLAHMAMKNGVRVVEMRAGQMFTEGEMEICCLAPNTSDGRDNMKRSNEDSMVLVLEYGKFDILFTGDVEEKGEEKLTEILKEEYLDTEWDVLKVAHHGSKNSTSEKFLGIVSPAYALISAGRGNSYGHPHEETIERLSSVKSVILSTHENGAINVMTDGKKMGVKGYVKPQFIK